MQEENTTPVMPAGSINKSREGMDNQNAIVEDSLAEFISKYYEDASKGPSVARYIDTKFGGNLDEAIATMVEHESTKQLAMALISYEGYVENLSQMKKAAAEANRPKKTRKDPIIRHDKICEVCGSKEPDGRIVKVGGADMMCCTQCQWLEDHGRNLTGKEKFEHLCNSAGIDPKLTEQDNNFPVITVQLKRGLPQHPSRPDMRLIVPNITNDEKQMLNGADKVTVKIIGVYSLDNIVKVRIVKTHKREVPQKKTFFARIFYRDGNIHVESATVKKRISIPREKKDEIFAKRELWGMWELEVLREKENEDFVFALPVQKIEEEKVPDRELPNVFFATVRIYDGSLEIESDKEKRITVPREMIPRLRYKLGVWKMRVIMEGDDFIFSKPIEHINNKGINRREYAARLNQLQTEGKIEL
jgi:hypothetical protein